MSKLVLRLCLGILVSIACAWASTNSGNTIQEEQHIVDLNSTYKVTAEALNVRQSADVNSKVLSTYSKGDRVKIISSDKNWVQTDKGWISGKYLEKVLSKKGTIHELLKFSLLLLFVYVICVGIVFLYAFLTKISLAFIFGFIMLIPLGLVLLIFLTPIVFFIGYIFYIIRNKIKYRNLNYDELVEQLRNLKDPGVELTNEEKEKYSMFEEEMRILHTKLRQVEDDTSSLPRNKDNSISQRSQKGKEAAKKIMTLKTQIDNLAEDMVNCSRSGEDRQFRYTITKEELEAPLIEEHEDKEVAWSFLISFISWIALLIYFFITRYDINDILSFSMLTKSLFIEYFNLFEVLVLETGATFNYINHAVLVGIPITIFFLSKYLFTFTTFKLSKQNDVDLEEKSVSNSIDKDD